MLVAMISVSAAYCPNCAALLSFEPGDAHVTCSYCDASLMMDTGRVTHQRSAPARFAAASGGAAQTDPESAAPIAQPNPSLFVRDAARFRTRIIEQVAADGGTAPPDLFRTVELEEDRFAIVSMRCVDGKSNPVPMDLEPAFEVLSESLGDDGDPGLSANLALEELSRNPSFQKLECAIALLDPARTTALVYSAGTRNAVFWVSTEEARPIMAGTNHEALERAHLAKVGSQFDNSKVWSLAAQDLLVFSSFAYLIDEAMGSNFPRLMLETLRQHLGEDPQRIVTLIKNGFWEQRETGREAHEPLAGDLRIAAVGARLAEVDDSGAAPAPNLEVFKSRHYHVAIQRAEIPAAEPGAESRPLDGVHFWPLSDDRHALLWMQYPDGVTAEALDAAKEAVHGVLGSSSGDFDNAREAGRRAVDGAMPSFGMDPAKVQMLVLHLSDEYQRVKFFARGWKAPITLGGRGIKPEHEQQQFDEGGECTIHENARLFFPGALGYEGNVIKAQDFSERWYGGKSSHLYEALRLHWRTRKSEKALMKIVRAAAADTSHAGTQGLALVTGV